MPQPNSTLTTTPVVLAINSLDPAGGAGISADIETLSSLGCHCAPIASQLTAREVDGVHDSQLTDSPFLIGQIRSVLEDLPVDLIKVGELASVTNAEAVHTILNDYAEIPVVLDPSFNPDDGELGMAGALRNLLLAQADITVLSETQAYQLAPGADTLAACVQELLEYGAGHILITDGNKSSSKTTHNQLYNHRGLCQHYQWPRLPQQYQGAGCTLSAALSGYLAHQLSIAESVQQAQKFNWQALEKGRRIGMGALLPDRLHWRR